MTFSCQFAKVCTLQSFPPYGIWAYLCSKLVIARELYATGFYWPFLCFWRSAAPSPYDEASAVTFVGSDKSYRHKTGVEQRIVLMVWKARCWGCSQTHWFLLLSKSHKGFVASASSGENLLSWLHIPKNRLKSLRDLGSPISRIAFTFSGSGFIPS